jgi:tryptophan 2,3-dioxygenase
MNRRSLWDSLLVLLHARTGRVPADVLSRDVSLPHEQDPRVQEVLIEAYRNDPEAALLLERFVDLDEGLQEWRYRHVKMVERTIGAKVGTGGSAGRDYLLGTLFRPVFPDLWAIRDRF